MKGPVTACDGKYTFFTDEDGLLNCLRHGEPWPAFRSTDTYLCGSVLALYHELLELKDTKTPHQKRVEEFMRSSEQPVRDRPSLPPRAERMLRARLILEEALETIEALGFSLETKGRDPEEVRFEDLEFIPTEKPDLAQVADGCADLSVVTVGTLSACGISDRSLLELVDQNNLEKIVHGSYRDEHGKLIKPPGHRPPDIEGLLNEQSL